MAEDRGPRLDRLPLFLDGATTARLVLGPQRVALWNSMAPLLEAKGMPKIDPLMGGRYWPAVRRWFDARHGIAERPKALDGREDLSAWRKKRPPKTPPAS